MKNIIDKSVIEGKLAELEQELMALEEVFIAKVSTNKMEIKLREDASRIDLQLTELISCLSIEKETQLKNDSYQSHASCFPFVATNI
ncbi:MULTISPECIES: hypothetical protein [Metabacillus]|uniref:Uncharacterized protein n=3 Tax=Metabacillus TaxID=2675233 RepID=A0A179SX13_9BACI|nr:MULTISPECIES: hypothetical protein [Metabacillus]OAS86297.1 hypothetical protein A6K24_21490 [Metabacillus litoralis]QNF30632.1 hypothetical protein HUW50_26080 [Metabacillus sp. KUDC1714]